MKAIPDSDGRTLFDNTLLFWANDLGRGTHARQRYPFIFATGQFKLPGGKIFFAGDTGFGDGSWAREAARHGPYRLAILPIGAYLPRDVMQANHMDPEEAVRVFEVLDPARAFAIHWGTFQLTFEAIDDPPRRLAAARKARDIPPERFVTTEVGRTFEVP